MINSTDVRIGILFCLKLTEQKPSRNVNLFDESSHFITQFMYVSLGVLAGMLLIGTLWDNLIRKKRGINQSTVLGEIKQFIVTVKKEIPISLYRLFRNP